MNTRFILNILSNSSNRIGKTKKIIDSASSLALLLDKGSETWKRVSYFPYMQFIDFFCFSITAFGQNYFGLHCAFGKKCRPKPRNQQISPQKAAVVADLKYGWPQQIKRAFSDEWEPLKYDGLFDYRNIGRVFVQIKRPYAIKTGPLEFYYLGKDNEYGIRHGAGGLLPYKVRIDPKTWIITDTNDVPLGRVSLLAEYKFNYACLLPLHEGRWPPG